MGWLNSDDLLAPGALVALAQAHRQYPNALIAGEVVWVNQDDGSEHTMTQRDLTFAHVLRFWTERSRYQQPGIFWPRTAYLAAGRIDETLHHSMDYDLFVRLLRHATTHYLHAPVARFRYHAGSKTSNVGDLFYLETYAVSQRYWNADITATDRLAARHFLAGYFARQATARLRGRQVRRAARLFGHALGFHAGRALLEPWAMSFAYVRRARAARSGS